MTKRTKLPSPLRAALSALGCILGVALFFLATCLGSAATVRSMSVLLLMLALSSAFLYWERLRERLKPPVLALALVVLMDLLSCAYAVSGKFALNEVLKVLSAFCIALILLSFVGEEKPERRAASILEGFAVIAGLVSIDLISTRWISTPVLTVLGWLTTDYMNLAVVENGVRITSVLIGPNVFAGCMGIGVLLSLGLVISSEKAGERSAHLACLSVNALAFVLAFSMGACIAIAPAFLVLLALTISDRRAGMLILMVETLVVTMLAAFPISLTSMTAWTGFRPIPLACTLGGAAALCAMDLLVGRHIAGKLAGHGKAVLCVTAALLAGIVIFAIAAYTFTAGITLHPGASLRRSAYPEPGHYTLTVETDGDPSVIIESQNQSDTTMHTSSELYRGPLSQAAFTVPEDSTVVWFRFSVKEETRLESVTYQGESGSGSIPLGYPLLPGFIANRLQGLWANQNAIQRLAFFADGVKLFLRSPVIGLGIGAYGNGLNGVQTFYYFTKYAHNHYIQALLETGIIGLVLFLGLLAVSALAVWRGRKRPLAPALGAALVFMAGHGAVEVIFSYFANLPMLFSVFATISLCCGDMIPLPAWAEKRTGKNGLTLGVCAMLAVFGVLLGCNIAARNMVNKSKDFNTLERAAALDPFEKADYMLTYVVLSTGADVEDSIREKADGYAQRLGKLESNSIPIYLAEYYLETGRMELGLEQAERYVSYVASDAVTWQKTFNLLEQYEQDTDTYRAGVVHIADLLDAWNAENMGHIALNGQAEAFIARMRG